MTNDEVAAIPLIDAWNVRNWFPRAIDFEIIAPSTWDYNCYAYAVGKDRWIDRFEFIETLDELGYEKLPDMNFEVEPGIEKVVVYHDDYCVTHGAVQRRDGRWESKAGPGPLVIHKTLECLNGPDYGKPWAVYARACEVAA